MIAKAPAFQLGTVIIGKHGLELMPDVELPSGMNLQIVARRQREHSVEGLMSILVVPVRLEIEVTLLALFARMPLLMHLTLRVHKSRGMTDEIL